MSVVVWMSTEDLIPPHGLDLSMPRDANKVNMLAEAFLRDGFDRTKAACIGYPLDGKVQMLSGSHRFVAAQQTKTLLPVVLWLRSSIEEAWGDLETWVKLMQDVSVLELETWTRDDVERMRAKRVD